MGVPDFGVLIIRILLFRVPYEAPLFSETPRWLLQRLGCSLGVQSFGLGASAGLAFEFMFF